jgi:acetyl-CoA carboxylase biotin carboxyl carrier protein
LIQDPENTSKEFKKKVQGGALTMAKKENGKKLNLEVLNEALKIMDKGDLVEMIYEEKDMKIQLKKAGAIKGTVQAMAAPQYMQAPPVSAPPASAVPSLEPKKILEDDKNGVIKSPMVGTFYQASSPDSPAFVKVGDMVEPGKTVCIIEAMKIMNEIKSEIKGRVKEILVDNAQAVEYNQPLITIEKV